MASSSTLRLSPHPGPWMSSAMGGSTMGGIIGAATGNPLALLGTAGGLGLPAATATAGKLATTP